METTPNKHFSEISLCSAVIGNNIWIYDSGAWQCFDTVQKEWLKLDLRSSKSFACSLHPQSLGIIGESIYFYDGNHNSFEKKVYQLNSVTKQFSSSEGEGFGEHPQERHDTFVLALSNDILLLYAPCESYERDKAEKIGELFYYDLKEAKWARVKQSMNNNPNLNFYAHYYSGRIGSSLIFFPTRSSNPNTIWSFNLDTMTWEAKTIEGDSTLFVNYATIVGDKIYCWMSDGQMNVIDVKGMPSQEEQRQIDERLANVAREALSAIQVRQVHFI